jgi:hypothetical protein
MKKKFYFGGILLTCTSFIDVYATQVSLPPPVRKCPPPPGPSPEIHRHRRKYSEDMFSGVKPKYL